MSKIEKIIAALLLGLVLWFCVFTYVLGLNRGKTSALCAKYAETDHSQEIAESRRKWLLDNGYDYNKDFDWYESCIKHSSNY